MCNIHLEKIPILNVYFMKPAFGTWLILLFFLISFSAKCQVDYPVFKSKTNVVQHVCHCQHYVSTTKLIWWIYALHPLCCAYGHLRQVGHHMVEQQYCNSYPNWCDIN